MDWTDICNIDCQITATVYTNNYSIMKPRIHYIYSTTEFIKNQIIGDDYCSGSRNISHQQQSF